MAASSINGANCRTATDNAKDTTDPTYYTIFSTNCRNGTVFVERTQLFIELTLLSNQLLYYLYNCCCCLLNFGAGCMTDRFPDPLVKAFARRKTYRRLHYDKIEMETVFVIQNLFLIVKHCIYNR